MNHHAATIGLGTANAASRRSSRVFARHFGEMLLAMFPGMVVLGGLSEPAFASPAAASPDQPGGFRPPSRE